MKNKKIQNDPYDELEAADRRLLAELERIVDRLPPHMFGDVVGIGDPEDAISTIRQGPGDVALPFLIFVDTRLN